MHKKWIIFTVSSSFIVSLALFGCSQQKQETTATTAKKVIKIGSETTFPPFEFQDEKTQDYVGFDIDLVKAIFKQAGYETEIVSTNFDGLIPAL